MTSVASADIYALSAAMRESARSSDVTTQEVLVNSANFIKSEMESLVPVDTGKLRQSIAVRVMTDRVVIGPDTHYALYVEFGTGPHVILAKPGKVLAFKMNGQSVFVKKVNHPGTKAQPYVRPAFESWADTLGELVADANIKRLEKAYR
jgi:HK97 gp10 family phage protein